ncbi:beta-2-glycoprotein 1-like [Clavelina lepadiformis]|uniref:beta-2-glycoprotein 1-like n=1 Tax=Clavelina lepadiformis TaxID=159417 RepID=UPI004042DC40
MSDVYFYSYTCNLNYYLVGFSEAECTDIYENDEFGDWTFPVATCQPIVCEPSFEELENGQVSCTNESYAGSNCTFNCDPTYKIEGNSSSYCLDDGDDDRTGSWTQEIPECQSNSDGADDPTPI